MRYAILSDIHGNLAALKSVLHDLEQHHIDAMICLGDVVGYYADSQAVIDVLRERLHDHPYNHNGRTEHGSLWLSGNHEHGLLNKIAAASFTKVARQTLEQTYRELTPDAIQLLESLPETIEIQLMPDLRATLVHATPADPVGASGYIENAEDARLALKELSTPLCIVGHTHRPSIFYATRRMIGGTPLWKEIFIGAHFPNTLATPHVLQLPAVINPGSVGQPRDGDNRASYGILEISEQSLSFTIYRVAYDIDDTIRRVQAWLQDVPDTFWNGPGSLSQRLKQGL